RKTVKKLEGMGVEWFVAIPRYCNVKQAIEDINESEWVDIGYTTDGVAQVAETMIVTKIDKIEHTVRLIIRRTRLADPEQQPLWKGWRHHTFATNNRDLAVTEADRMYRNHARVELGIRDLKHHTGLVHCPSGRFFANAAWMAAAVIAHNLYRWINHHTGQGSPQQLTNEKHRPQPPLSPPRKNRQPRRTTDSAATHKLAMGTRLPDHPPKHPRPATTLLTPHQISAKTNTKTPLPQNSARPHTPLARSDTPPNQADTHQTSRTRHKTIPHAPEQPKSPRNPTPGRSNRWIEA
ncbi:MAG: transposase, partial [bacterium]|nr:transposase [bacterium]